MEVIYIFTLPIPYLIGILYIFWGVEIISKPSLFETLRQTFITQFQLFHPGATFIGIGIGICVVKASLDFFKALKSQKGEIQKNEGEDVKHLPP